MVLPHEPEFQQAYDELVSAVEDSTLFKEEPQYKKLFQLFLSQKESFNSESLGKTTKVKSKSTTVSEFNTTFRSIQGWFTFPPNCQFVNLEILGF